MKPSQMIIEIVSEKYSEWLEMAGEISPACKAALLIEILASLLAKEVEEKLFYKYSYNQRDES